MFVIFRFVKQPADAFHDLDEPPVALSVFRCRQLNRLSESFVSQRDTMNLDGKFS